LEQELILQRQQAVELVNNPTTFGEFMGFANGIWVMPGWLWGVFTLVLFFAAFGFTKWYLGNTLHQSTVRLTDKRAVVKFKDTWRYAIPYVNNTLISKIVDMTFMEKINPMLGGATIATYCLYSLAELLIFIGLFIHPTIYMLIAIVYWICLGASYLLDVVFMYRMCQLFNMHGMTRFFSILPPVCCILMAYMLPHYFKENKDALTGAFDQTEEVLS